MESESGILAIRERNPMEAIDQGAVILRTFGHRLYPLVGIPLLVVGGLLFALVPWPWLPPLLLWWLKPVWDRLVLVPASYLIFHPNTPFPELLRQLRRISWLDLLWDLTWRRFSPFRSYLLPVRILEGLPPRDRRRRLKQLAARNPGQATLLTAILLTLEWAIYFSCIPLLDALFPDIATALGFQTPYGQPCLGTLLYLACLLVVEPFYALAGFGLYLNSRTIMEGWDLALIFRSLGKQGKPLILVLILAASLLAAPVAIQAQSPGDTGSWEDQARKVLANPEFGTEQEVPTWVLRQEETERPSPEPSLPPGPNVVSTAFGQGLFYILVAVLAVIIIAILVSIFRRHKSVLPARDKGDPDQPELQFLADKGPGDTPATWESQARGLWLEGRHSDALALLYRIILDRLQQAESLSVPDSATELDCSRLVATHPTLDGQLKTLFQDIVAARVRITYALKPLADMDFYRLYDQLQILGTPGDQS